MVNLKRIILLLACLTILFVAPFIHGQETPTVLKPNQLMTFSLAPGQEKVFVLQMKKGDFVGIESLAREGLNLSFEIYDSARKELLDKSDWFVAPRDGNLIVVCKLEKSEGLEITGAQRISIQYNNKFKLPAGTKLQSIRRVKGYDVKIMSTPESSEGGDTGYPVFLIEKNGKLQKAMKGGEGDSDGFVFDHGCCEAYQNFADNLFIYSKDNLYIYSDGSDKSKRGIQLIKTTPEIIRRKTKSTGRVFVDFSDEIPDLVISYFSGGRYCCGYTYFFELGDTVKMSQPISREFSGIGKNPKGGWLFEAAESSFANWFKGDCLPSTTCARPSFIKVILELRNGILRPNFDLMKKAAPSLAVLRSKAQKFRTQLSVEPYRGAENLNGLNFDEFRPPMDHPGLLSKDDLGDESPFWDVMIDLIYTGNEELAWQFLDLVWPPQKQGKALFIRDFKKQLSESQYWKMILEDRKK